MKTINSLLSSLTCIIISCTTLYLTSEVLRIAEDPLPMTFPIFSTLVGMFTVFGPLIGITYALRIKNIFIKVICILLNAIILVLYIVRLYIHYTYVI